MVMMVPVVPSVALINGKGRERRTQQRQTEQYCNQRFLH
jgi:hypothetical protein